VIATDPDVAHMKYKELHIQSSARRGPGRGVLCAHGVRRTCADTPHFTYAIAHAAYEPVRQRTTARSCSHAHGCTNSGAEHLAHLSRLLKVHRFHTHMHQNHARQKPAKHQGQLASRKAGVRMDGGHVWLVGLPPYLSAFHLVHAEYHPDRQRLRLACMCGQGRARPPCARGVATPRL